MVVGLKKKMQSRLLDSPQKAYYEPVPTPSPKRIKKSEKSTKSLTGLGI